MHLSWMAECLCGTVYELLTPDIPDERLLDAEADRIGQEMWDIGCHTCHENHSIVLLGPALVDDDYSLMGELWTPEPHDTPLDEWLAGVDALLAEVRDDPNGLGV
jgi:hypothetical protein